MTDLMEQLNELRTEESLLSDRLKDLQLRIHALKLDIIFEKYQVRQGSIVRSTHNGGFYYVTEVDLFLHSIGEKPWLVGNPQLKNGSFGTARRHLRMDWEVLEP